MENKYKTARESSAWSNNEVGIFINNRQGYLALLKEAIWWIEEHENDLKSGESLARAIQYKQNMDASYNRANNAHFRMEALIKEVRALRSGTGITYAKETDDPVRDDFALPLPQGASIE